MDFITNFFLRVLAFSLLWIVLVNGALDSWVIGIPMVIMATFISIKLLPSTPISFIGLVKFIPFFLWHSLLGGFDVAKRVFYAEVKISPTMFLYRWRLPEGLSRVFMAKVVSLFPGTLAVDLGGEYLQIHALDDSVDLRLELMSIEKKVADMFKIDISAVER
ncbi:MAG: cation transporter [Sulfurovum sp.]|nr:MAG: cation transporter [Sulfurovum sp.]